MQPALDIGDGDDDDRDVQQQHERTDTNSQQRPPLLLHGYVSSPCLRLAFPNSEFQNPVQRKLLHEPRAVGEPAGPRDGAPAAEVLADAVSVVFVIELLSLHYLNGVGL